MLKFFFFCPLPYLHQKETKPLNTDGIGIDNIITVRIVILLWVQK